MVQAPGDGSTKLDKKYVDYNYSAGNSGSFTNAREVQKRFDLDPGTYVVLPCAFKPGDEGEFLVRIFTEKSAKKEESSKKEEAPRYVCLIWELFSCV